MTIESSISSILHITREIINRLARIENLISGIRIIIETNKNETIGCIRVFSTPKIGDMIIVNDEVYSVYQVVHLYDLPSGKIDTKIKVLRNED